MPAASGAVVDRVAHARRARLRRRGMVVAVLVGLVAVGWVASLVFGHTTHSLGEVVGVVLGHEVDGASFTVGHLRLPRATMAVVGGTAFGLSGVTFQTLLRNPLASPDIIGITPAASAAAAFALLTLGWRGPGVWAAATIAGIGVAVAVYALSHRGGVAGTRLILIGIGMAAMMHSVIAAQLDRASDTELPEVLRWLAGSLNGAGWSQVVPTAVALVVLGTALLALVPNLSTLQLGDDTASGLGVRVERTRLALIVVAVGLICFATAATGPIAFVAFLSGPIAARIVGRHGSLVVPAGLVGALLVLVSDFAGQWLLPTRLPVGVVTGVLGAPWLVHLIARSHRTGGSL